MQSKSHSRSSETVGLAVGLGVGIPVLITIILFIWLTVRHRRKIREENEQHEKIDFGEVSFWDGSQTPFDAKTPYTSDTSENDSSLSLKEPRSIYASSVVTSNESIPGFAPPMAPPSVLASPSHMSLYAPSIEASQDETTLTRQLNSVYGPSPAYPSSGRLRMASSGSIHSIPNSPRSSVSYAGPFATPPRRFAGERRMSNGSVATSHSIENREPIGHQPLSQTPLQDVREAVHPYADLAGNTSLSVGVVPNATSVVQDDHEKGKHHYHTQAENRQSVFEY